MRWAIPFSLTFLLWCFLAGVWLHDWQVMLGSLVAFVAVIALEEYEAA